MRYFQANRISNINCDSVWWNPTVAFQDSTNLKTPIDSDEDSLPDYFEDWSGDGSASGDATDWQVPESASGTEAGLIVFTHLD